MTHGYTDIGDAIFAHINDLDIVGVYDENWAERYNTPPKQWGGFPSFAVVPSSDQQTTLDSRNDADIFQFSLYLFDSFYDSQTAEDRMRQLVDLVREHFRSERDKSSPLGLSGLYDLQLSGEWGGDEEHGHRYYRLGLTVRVRQELA